MKPDVLTITAVVFVASVLISSLGTTEDLNSRQVSAPPSALQLGVVTK